MPLLQSTDTLAKLHMPFFDKLFCQIFPRIIITIISRHPWAALPWQISCLDLIPHLLPILDIRLTTIEISNFSKLLSSSIFARLVHCHIHQTSKSLSLSLPSHKTSIPDIPFFIAILTRPPSSPKLHTRYPLFIVIFIRPPHQLPFFARYLILIPDLLWLRNLSLISFLNFLRMFTGHWTVF